MSTQDKQMIRHSTEIFGHPCDLVLTLYGCAIEISDEALVEAVERAADAIEERTLYGSSLLRNTPPLVFKFDHE